MISCLFPCEEFTLLARLNYAITLVVTDIVYRDKKRESCFIGIRGALHYVCISTFFLASNIRAGGRQDYENGAHMGLSFLDGLL